MVRTALLTVVVGLVLCYEGAYAQTTEDGLLMPLSTTEPDQDLASGSDQDTDNSGFGQSGLGMSGSGMDLTPEVITCSNPVQRLQVSLFDSIYTSLSAFECVLTSTPDLDANNSNNTEPSLLFIVHLDDELDLNLTQDDIDKPFIEYFDIGTYAVTITACSRVNFACDPKDIFELGNITLVLGTHQRRLFPYGETLNDKSFRNVLDGAVQIPLTKTIPFWSSYYNKVYVSSNGLVSFNSPYISWWPIPFPYGQTVDPIIAPYWTDLDFRNTNFESSKVYYQTYSVEDSQMSKSYTLLNLFTDRLRRYVGDDVTFQPEWMAVITWNEATPYYWRYNANQTVTFQLVLATDYINTYAFYLYQPGGFSAQLPSWQRVVVGYDAKDNRNFHNVELSSLQYSIIDSAVGNTGEMGQWYFNFTTSTLEADSEQLCMEWAKRQDTDIFNSQFSGLPSCPCTFGQARRDWRFWFAHFWGLSSRSNCATFLWSRRQATLECCYENDGSLLVGPSSGGSYLLYNPLFSYRNHFLEDRLAYQYCCIDSQRCNLYYTHRPSDNCSNYRPLRRFFIFGDPHFVSIDNNNFTFNGIGEYILLKSPTNNLTIQSRLEQYDPNTPGSVMTSVVIKEGTTQSVQVNVESGGFKLTINGMSVDLPSETSPIIVTSMGVTDIVMPMVSSQGGAFGTSTSVNSDQVFVRRDDDSSLIITTPKGASLSVRLENSFMGVAVELSEDFRDKTSGLLGVFNGNPSDDFTLPNGSVLDISSEKDIYQFGLQWHITQQESLFSYGDFNFSTINDGYLEFEPTFYDDLNITQEVMDACGTNQACIQDALLTGDLEVGASTLNASLVNDELDMILDNHQPNILSGDFVLYVKTMDSINAMYMVEDPDTDLISALELTGHESSGITFNPIITDSMGTLELIWSNPGYGIPPDEIRIVATDNKGAATSHRISIILCGCMNGGICAELSDDLQLNFKGHLKRLCICPEYYGGESCEIEMRGCEFNVCPDYAECVNDSNVEPGYTCSNCSEGYSIIMAGEENKCFDKDECNETTPTHSCDDVCINTEGSYTCDCHAGYRLASDGQMCEDINECEEDISNCSQVCKNVVGNFSCSCYPGFIINETEITECQLATCAQNPCDSGLRCGNDDNTGKLECICPVGKYCNGTCSGSYLNISNTEQACTVCRRPSYGFNCQGMCNCDNGGTCDIKSGCVCTEGWKGENCSVDINNYSPIFDPRSLITSPLIQWDLLANSVVASIRATDNDTNPNSGSVMYSIVRSTYNLPDSVSDGIDFFNISASGDVYTMFNLADVFRLHGTTSFTLTVQAIDLGQTPKSIQAALTVVPRPVPVLTNNLQMIELSENTAIGSVVFNHFNCSEIGPPTNSLALTLNNPSSGLFAFNQDTSSLIVSQLLDYEVLVGQGRTMFSSAVVCSNHYQITDSILVHIEITNEDDNPFVFDMQSYSVFILENTTRGDEVLSIMASDADVPDASVRYTFVEDLADFLISLQDGDVHVSRELDRETQGTYNLQVLAQLIVNNEVINTVTANVTITLTDVNDERPFFLPSKVYIVNDLFSDNNPGDFVVAIEAQDQDSGSNGDVRYKLEENDFFIINETSGYIIVNSILSPNLRIRLIVYAIDMGVNPLNSSAEVDIFVLPSPERLQFEKAMYTFSLSEDASRGNSVGSVRAAIIDDNNTTFNATRTHQVEYSIIIGSNASIFAIDRVDGVIFLLSGLDFEKVQDYFFEVRAELTSNESISTQSVVRVRIMNINDNPPRFSARFYTSVVEEFTPAGRTILTVSATDVDSENITFSLKSSVDSSIFLLNQDTGVLTAQEELMDILDYRFLVIAYDGELMSEAVVFISVTRSISLAPSFTRDKYVFNISENTEPGTYVGTIEALTRGNISSAEFSHLEFRLIMPDMIGSNSNISDNNEAIDLFHVNPISGNISTLTSFEFDSESQVIFVFYVGIINTNNNTVYDRVPVEVQLTDVNDNEPIFSQSLYTRVIYTSQPKSSVILTVTATDADSTTNSDIDYEIQGPLGFMLVSQTGNVSISNTTLIPGNYYLTVIASDRGNPGLYSSSDIFIVVLSSTPEQVEFNQSTYNFSISEDAIPGTLVGIVHAFDTTRNDSLATADVVYSTPNLTLCLSLDPNDGEIRVSCTLDRETTPKYDLELVATVIDTNSTVMGFSRLIVDILDVNDNPPIFSLDVYAAIINDMFNETILNVMATDSDHEANGTVQYRFYEEQGLNVTSYFEIDMTTGEVAVSPLIPVLPVGDYRLTVIANDLGTPYPMFLTALVLICVTRSQPDQLDFQTTQLFINEAVEPGTFVGIVLLKSGMEIINPTDYSNNLEFSIIDADMISSQLINSSTALFSINEMDGTVQTTGRLDREEAFSHVIVIVANFTLFGISEQTSITIDILDQNDVRPMFIPTIYFADIDDSRVDGEVILNITVVDYDEGSNANISFSISETTEFPFGVEHISFNPPKTCAQIVVSNVSHLIPRDYTFSLIGTDGGTPSLNETAYIHIIVRHTLPDEIFFPSVPYVFNFTENLPEGSFVGSVSVVQETPALDNLLYSITSGNDFGHFTIDSSSGMITSRRSTNRESISSFNLTIRALLIEEPTLTPAITFVLILITDVNDNSPVFSRGSYSTVILTNEVTTTNSILRVQARDNDEGRNAQIQFSITSGNLDNFFSVDNTGGIFATLAPLNVSTYQLTVTAEDMGESPMRANVPVFITIQEGIPSEILFTQPNGYSFTVNEGSAINIPIGQVMLQQIRMDLVQFVTFTENSTSLLVDRLGNVRSTRILDYETSQNHVVSITATLNIPIEVYTPQTILTTTVQMLVLVEDINDNTPILVSFPPALSQLESRTSEEIVVQVNATDADSGLNQQLWYELLNTDTFITSNFRIDPTSGILFASPNLDREAQDAYDLIIEVCDMGATPRCDRATTRFTLLDINDNVPMLTSGTLYEVRERQPAGTSVFTLTASDPDLGTFGVAGLRYNLRSLRDDANTDLGNDAVFTLNEESGVVLLLAELDYENVPSYRAEVEVRDNSGSGGLTGSFEITISVVNEPDNRPSFDLPPGQTMYSLTTDPTLTSGETVISVHAIDADPTDTIRYSIVSTTQEGNGETIPQIRIDENSGDLISEISQQFRPEAIFTITVQAFDNSQFNLDVMVVVSITVLPEHLIFEESSYTIDESENVAQGSELVQLAIHPLSVSSQISYSITVDPAGQASVFTSSGNGGHNAIISLASGQGFDRERIDRYTIIVRATRPNPFQETESQLVIIVNDENDNTPTFTDGINPVIRVTENIPSQTVISQINVTDSDIGQNGLIVFTFDPPLPGLPFDLNEHTGVLTIIGTIDYELVQSYSLRIRASDSASQPRHSILTYTVEVLNENDEFPMFSAPAYFGELYALSPVNGLVQHVTLSVTDADDVNNEQDFTFNIESPIPGRDKGYTFEVTDGPPYHVIVKILPVGANPVSTQINLRVYADDGRQSSNVPLLISIYTSDSLVPFDIVGVTKDELESCSVRDLSLCEFLDTLGGLVQIEMSARTSFYNHSVIASSLDTEDLMVMVYGWYGDFYNDARINNGELKEATNFPLLEYIIYSEHIRLFTTVTSSSEFNYFDFSVSLGVEATVAPEPVPTVIVIGVVCAMVFGGLVIILIIVLVCVFGRKKDSPRRRRRKQSDPYLRKPKTRRTPRKSRRGSKEEIALTRTAGGSDLAYETMYDDDEMLDQHQTMPWFDPKYLAAEEQYEGDNELPSIRTSHPKPTGPVRATVDGNARRQRRYSSDESAAAVESVSDIDTAGYLRQYQQSTPMQPSQRMGELDMFASPADPDKPFRPSLDQYQWQKQPKSYK